MSKRLGTVDIYANVSCSESYMLKAAAKDTGYTVNIKNITFFPDIKKHFAADEKAAVFLDKKFIGNVEKAIVALNKDRLSKQDKPAQDDRLAQYKAQIIAKRRENHDTRHKIRR